MVEVGIVGIAVLTDDDRPVTVGGARLADDTPGGIEDDLLAAVDPFGSLTVSLLVFLPADDDAPVTGDFVGAARSGVDAAEIDHAGRLLPSKPVCDFAAVPG